MPVVFQPIDNLFIKTQVYLSASHQEAVVGDDVSQVNREMIFEVESISFFIDLQIEFFSF